MAESTVYLVEWLDSASVDAWHDADSYVTPLHVTTVGHMIREENEYIFMAATRDENGRWCSGMAIPRSAIQSMKTWDPDANS